MSELVICRGYPWCGLEMDISPNCGFRVAGFESTLVDSWHFTSFLRSYFFFFSCSFASAVRVPIFIGSLGRYHLPEITTHVLRVRNLIYSEAMYRTRDNLYIAIALNKYLVIDDASRRERERELAATNPLMLSVDLILDLELPSCTFHR